MGSKRKATRDLEEVNKDRTGSDSEETPEGNGEEGICIIDDFCFLFLNLQDLHFESACYSYMNCISLLLLHIV